MAKKMRRVTWLSVRLSEGEMRALKLEGKERGASVGGFVRQVLAEAVAEARAARARRVER